MATWFAVNSSVDIDSANQWNDQADGLGSFLTWASLGATDILVANGKTNININVSFTCDRITTTASGGTAGGTFICSSAVTITADLLPGSTNCLACTHASGTTVTIVGDLIGSSTTNTIFALTSSSTGTIVITGSITGGGNAIARGVQFNGAGTITITGDVSGGSGASADGIFVNGNATISITGTVTAGSSRGCAVNNASGGVVTVVGTIVNSTTCPALGGTGGYRWDPGAGHYMQWPKTSGTQNYYPSGSLLKSRLIG